MTVVLSSLWSVATLSVHNKCKWLEWRERDLTLKSKTLKTAECSTGAKLVSSWHKRCKMIPRPKWQWFCVHFMYAHCLQLWELTQVIMRRYHRRKNPVYLVDMILRLIITLYNRIREVNLCLKPLKAGEEESELAKSTCRAIKVKIETLTIWSNVILSSLSWENLPQHSHCSISVAMQCFCRERTSALHWAKFVFWPCVRQPQWILLKHFTWIRENTAAPC